MTLAVDFGVQLEAGLGSVRDEVRRSADRTIDTLRAQEPMDVRLVSSGSVASGDLVLNFGGPEAGYYWMVRRIIVGGLQWSTTAAGSAEVYVTAMGGGNLGSSGQGYASQRLLSDLVDQSIALPNKATYGLHELPVNSGENVLVVIHTPTASQIYVATVQAQVFRHVTERGTFSV